jgi:peptide/nickel transport system ATP-binding protein
MLCVSNLSVDFARYGQALGTPAAIRSLDLTVDAGQILAVVGESGSGKSLLAHAILGLLPSNSRVGGSITFKGQVLDQENVQALRGREIALIPQSVAYLNPLKRVGSQVLRAATLSGLEPTQAAKVRDTAFERYGLGFETQRLYPHQISGGMSRRVLTATATTGNASLVVADEPTTGLDQKTALESLRHLRELANSGAAVLLITHDIEACLDVADRVAVFLGGMVVEIAKAADFSDTSSLRHPYTRTLWQALPHNDFMDAPAKSYKATTANQGCVHAGDCPQADALCGETIPAWREMNGGLVRCHHA